MHARIYKRLKEVAAAGGIVSYSEIAPLAGLNMDNPDDRNRLGSLLGVISTHEYDEGRPLLSAVVVHAANGVPGEGFFTLARELGVPGTHDQLAFFSNELNRVHAYWTKQKPPQPKKAKKAKR